MYKRSYITCLDFNHCLVIHTYMYQALPACYVTTAFSSIPWPLSLMPWHSYTDIIRSLANTFGKYSM